MNSIQEWLNSVPVKKILRIDSKNLISLSPTDSISKALETLAFHSITSAPVYDSAKDSWYGFVDVLDLAVFVAKVFSENFEKHPHLYDPKELKQIFSHPVTEAINFSNRDPFMPVDATWSVFFLINNFMKWGIHHVPVVENNHIIGIVSQTDILRFLLANRNAIGDITTKQIRELNMDNGPVISVTNDVTLMKAFSMIVKHNVSGIAVLDLKGTLINNLSASDLKGITETTFFKLEAPIHQVLMGNPDKLPPVTCSPHSTLAQALGKMEKTGVHRIFVVDDSGHPLNVITVTSILQLFASS